MGIYYYLIDNLRAIDVSNLTQRKGSRSFGSPVGDKSDLRFPRKALVYHLSCAVS